MEEDFFPEIVEKVVRIEGGYSNDPDDPGGETNWGITKKTALRAGYDKPMVDMTKEDAINIYRINYWNVMSLDKIRDKDIALELFDSGVNMGNHYPQLWLQENLNALNNQGKRWPDIDEDANIGSTTGKMVVIACENKDIKESLLKLLNADQAVRYKNIVRARQKSEKYLHGWLKQRVNLPSGH